MLTAIVGKSQNLSAKKMFHDTLQCLEIKGKISNAAEDNSICKVELLSSAGVIDSVILEKGIKKFRFHLAKNSYYAIRISKKGFVTKLIAVETEFPDDIIDVCTFSFNTALISQTESLALDRDALDFPIAIIHFNTHTESFVYAKEYTDSIKKEIYGSREGKMLASAEQIDR